MNEQHAAQPGDRAIPPRLSLITAAIALLFLLIRGALLLWRAPFFDELFTLWLARKPIGQVLPALLHDSGPPLYYFLARLPSVYALRWLSVLFAAATLALIVARRSLGPPRLVAALLLAVYPAAALYATEARSYALCGFFVALAVLEIDGDRPWSAALALVAAAYTHYYGVLFFPLLLLRGRRGALPLATACLLFAPGFWLAAHQPREAMGWNLGGPWWAPLRNLPFAATGWLGAVALAVLVLAVARSWRFAPAVLLPLAAVVAAGLTGRNIYFPGRFESVIAAPLALWIAFSAARWRREVRTFAVAALAVIGAVACAAEVVNYRTQPRDDYRAAAVWLAQSAPPDALVVATGYLYLETIVLRPALAFPPEQAEHPGWRARARDGRGLPRATFLWIGERGAPELALMRGRVVEPLCVNARAMVARVR